MKTFIINEVRFNEKGEAFEVETKMQFESINVLLRYLRDKPNLLFKGAYTIREEGRRISETKKQIGTLKLDREENYQGND